MGGDADPDGATDSGDPEPDPEPGPGSDSNAGGSVEDGENDGVSATWLYAVAVLAGLLSTGVLVPGVVLGAWDVAYYRTHPFAVPPQVLLYAYLGALAHLLIALYTAEFEREALVGVLLRLPAAVFVAPGIYLLAGLLDLQLLPWSPQGTHELALLAYLAGLFVERAIRALRATSARLYPGDPAELPPDDVRRSDSR